MIITITGAIARLFLELLLTSANIDTPIETNMMIDYYYHVSMTQIL